MGCHSDCLGYSIIANNKLRLSKGRDRQTTAFDADLIRRHPNAIMGRPMCMVLFAVGSVTCNMLAVTEADALG